MKNITIGCHLLPQCGQMSRMRNAWIQAEELGADRIYTSDHFNAITVDAELVSSTNDGTHSKSATSNKNIFEGTTIQAAMAATTSRAEIGCLVHGNSYRNPNLMAFIASTIDHISGGRFVLGMGSGYHKADYDDFGYEYGTQSTRSLALARDIPILLDRFSKLSPPPIRHIPLMIASMGEKIGLRTVAQYADIWHVYGAQDKILEKAEILKGICKEIGRNVEDIELATFYFPELMTGSKDNPDHYIQMGITHIIVVAQGPKWDLGLLREMVAWRKLLP